MLNRQVLTITFFSVCVSVCLSLRHITDECSFFPPDWDVGFFPALVEESEPCNAEHSQTACQLGST